MVEVCAAAQITEVLLSLFCVSSLRHAGIKIEINPKDAFRRRGADGRVQEVITNLGTFAIGIQHSAIKGMYNFSNLSLLLTLLCN